MSTPHLRLILLTSLIFGFPSCATRSKIVLHPVHNPKPPISAGVYEASQVTGAPTRISQNRPTEPLYPSEFQDAAISGKSVVLLTVTKKGRVRDPMILDATDIRFGASALEAVYKWKFRPASLNGKAVNCRISVPIKFRILS